LLVIPDFQHPITNMHKIKMGQLLNSAIQGNGEV
jgi:hypothetical protein